MKPLDPIQRLITRLARLPGVGKRSAERMAYRVALDQRGLARELVAALQEVDEQVGLCSVCGNLTLKSQDPCAICTDRRRNTTLLCVVEDAMGVQQMEASGGYHGVYHCIGGKLSPMQGQDIPPERLQSLLKRIREGGVQEVILAFDHDTESSATAHYLQDALGSANVKITRLGFGIPAGSGLQYSDPVTLSRALAGRQAV